MMNKKYGLLLSILVSTHCLSGMVIDTSVDPDKGFEKSIDVVPEKPKSSSIVAPGAQPASPADDKSSADQKVTNQDAGVKQNSEFKNDNLDTATPSSEPAKPAPSPDGAAPQDAPKETSKETSKEGEKKEGSEIDYQSKGDTLKNEVAKADTENKPTAFYGDSSKEYTETQMVAGEDQNSKEAEGADDMAMMLAAGAVVGAVGVGALGAAMAKGDLDALGDKVKDKVQGKSGRTDYKRAAVKAEINKKLLAREEDKLKTLKEKTFEDNKKGKKKQAKNAKKMTDANERIKALHERQTKLDAKLADKEKKLSKKAKNKVSKYQQFAKEKAKDKSVLKKAKADFDAKQKKATGNAKLPSLPKIKFPKIKKPL